MAAFKAIITTDLTAEYTMTSDVNFSDGTFTSSDNFGTFNGVLDGNGHTVNGMVCWGSGMFNFLTGALVKNLNIIDVQLKGYNCGILASTNYTKWSWVENVYISVKYLPTTAPSSGQYIGGVVGYNGTGLNVVNSVVYLPESGYNMGYGYLKGVGGPTVYATNFVGIGGIG